MARRRFFVPEVRHDQAELTGDDAKHLTQVLRVETGQVYEISDTREAWLAEVTAARKALVQFRVIEKLPAAEPLVPLAVLVSLVKFERLETIFEKATELGATEIRLVRSERSEKGLEMAAPKRMPRWQRIVMEAGQQSRRVELPSITGPVPFKHALDFKADARLLLDEERSGQPLLAAARTTGPAALLIGPEGGWVDHEREAARAAGWTPVSLGPLILRTETAAIAALAVVNAARLTAV